MPHFGVSHIDVDAVFVDGGIRGIVAVLNLHARCLANINRRSPVLRALGRSTRDHEPLERLVRLLLAVADAQFLGIIFSREIVSIHAVQVALAEQQLRKSVLSVDVLSVVWIAGPV